MPIKNDHDYRFPVLTRSLLDNRGSGRQFELIKTHQKIKTGLVIIYERLVVRALCIQIIKQAFSAIAISRLFNPPHIRGCTQRAVHKKSQLLAAYVVGGEGLFDVREG